MSERQSAEFDAVPDPTTRRWLVKWHDITLSLTDAEYDALKRAAMDDPQEAMRLAETYRTARAEADALRQHQAGTCHLSEWSCSYCEADDEEPKP